MTSQDAMGDAQEITPGEIQRSLARLEVGVAELRAEVRERHHTLANEMTKAIGPISVHSVQIENQQRNLERHEHEIDAIDRDLKLVTATANRISGVGAMLAILSSLVPWPWKH